jgi:ABC-type cobalamin transport system permease subunit
LLVPHTLRLVLGPDHRLLLPGSALGGAAFVVLMDAPARYAIRPNCRSVCSPRASWAVVPVAAAPRKYGYVL